MISPKFCCKYVDAITVGLTSSVFRRSSFPTIWIVRRHYIPLRITVVAWFAAATRLVNPEFPAPLLKVVCPLDGGIVRQNSPLLPIAVSSDTEKGGDRYFTFVLSQFHPASGYQVLVKQPTNREGELFRVCDKIVLVRLEVTLDDAGWGQVVGDSRDGAGDMKLLIGQIDNERAYAANRVSWARGSN